MSTRTTLAAATQDRKARLAQLKSLKRKQPDSSSYDESNPAEGDEDGPPPAKIQKSPTPETAGADATAVVAPDVTTLYLSGRNFDTTTRGAKLGFESAPDEGQVTLEAQAADIAAQTKAQAEAEAAADKPLDLFSLQPKKPNWDLKRDLAAKMKILDVRTENAIARLVRDRIEAQKARALEAKNGAKGQTNGSGGGVDGEAGEEVGMEGAALVEAMHVREREEQADAQRERELDEDLEGS